jgi:hypothetical protein
MCKELESSIDNFDTNLRKTTDHVNGYMKYKPKGLKHNCEKEID